MDEDSERTRPPGPKDAGPPTSAPPPTVRKADEILMRRVRLLVLCGAIAFALSTVLNVGLAIWTSVPVTAGLAVIMAAMWFGWSRLSRRVPVRAIAHATLGGCVVAICALATSEGTTKTPNLHFLSLIVVASALLLGVRASRFWTAASLVAAFATYAADAWLGQASGLLAFNHGLGLTIMLVVLHMLASAAWRVADTSMAESEKAADRAREAALELEVANEALSAAMQARSRFLANMSHEIRTPLNAVLGFTDVLLHTHLDNDQRQYTDTIRVAGQGLLVIVDDVLDLARIEAGKLTFTRETIDLAGMIGSSLDMLGVAAHKKGLEIWGEIDEDARAQIDADPARVRQVLLNLIGNAVKFTGAGHVVVALRRGEDGASARIEVRDTGIGIAESARDALFQPFGQADASTRRRHEGTGLGLVISKKLVEGMGGRIDFTSTPGVGSCFWIELPGAKPGRPRSEPIVNVAVVLVAGRPIHSDHLAAELTKQVRGGVTVLHAEADAAEVGVALAAAPRSIAVIDVDPASSPPEELVNELCAHDPPVRVLLLVPLSQKADLRERWPSHVAVVYKPVRMNALIHRLGALETGDRAPPSQPPKATRFHHRVLLVEDNVVNQTVARLILQSTGCSVRIASDGNRAVAALAAEEFDLVLMDLHMPDMDGFDATRAIRAEERTTGRAAVPIVALSASVLPEDQEKCLDVGMNGHLAKPISRPELENLLRAIPSRTSAQG